MENTRPEPLDKGQAVSKKTKKSSKGKGAMVKFPLPETPEECYTRAESYLVGAECCVPFQERANYLKKASDMFARAGDFRDAPARVQECARLAEETLSQGYEDAYETACALRKNAKTEPEYFKAARAFERIRGYKDAEEQADACERKLQHIHARKIPVAIAVLVLVAGVVVGCVMGARSDAFRYHLGNLFSLAGMDSVSATLYSAAHGYADADEQLERCYYRQGVKALNRNDYDSSLAQFAKLSQPYEDSDTLRYEAEQQLLQSAQPGQEIYFGDAKWAVLAREDDRVLLLASSPLSTSEAEYCFDPECDATDWTQSWLSDYLNDVYVFTAFNDLEREAIDCTYIEGDYLFLLSIDEYLQYSDIITDDDFISKTDWWLRDMGSVEGTAACVTWNAKVNRAGCSMDSTVIRVRPALWVNVTN